MRLRAAELVALAAAVALVALLFGDWIDPRESGWSSINAASAVLIALSVVSAAVLVVTIISGQTVAAQVVSAIVAVWVTAITLVVLAVDVIRIGADDDLALRWPAYAGLGMQAVLFAAAWRSMSDERTTARGAAYEPPPARSLPES